MKNDFTLADGLAVQRKQLNQWKKILNAKSYTRLSNWLKTKNAELSDIDKYPLVDGYSVTRGTDLDMFVQNNLMLENNFYTEPQQDNEQEL